MMFTVPATTCYKTEAEAEAKPITPSTCAPIGFSTVVLGTTKLLW